MPFVGGGGSPQGSLRWIAQLDVTQFKQGTATVKSELTGIGQTAKQASTTGIAPLNQAFNPLAANMQKTTQGMSQVQKSTVGMNSAFNAGLTPITKNQNALGGLITSQGNFITSSGKAQSSLSKVGGAMKNNLAAVGLLAGGIAGLDDQYLALHKAQVANERAQLMESKSHQQVVKTQKALNDMRDKGLQGTEEYAIKLKDLELAQEKERISQERATVTQENLSEATEDFWVGIIPNALFIGGSAAQLIKEMGINSNNLKNILPKLGGAFTSLGGAISRINWASLLTSLAGIAGPILAAIGAIWLLVGAYQGLSNVSASIIEMNNLQVESLNPLQLGWLSLQDTLSNIFDWVPKLTDKQKHDLDTYNKVTTAELDRMTQRAKEAGADLTGEFSKGFTTLPKPVMDTISKLGTQLGEAFSGIGKGAADSAADMDIFTDSAYDLGAGLAFVSDTMLAQLKASDAHNAKIDEQIKLYNRLYPQGEKSRQQASKYTGTIIEQNKALVAEAKELGFTEEELKNLTYTTTDSAFQTEENNQRLKGIIETLKSYAPHIDASTTAAAELTAGLVPWAEGYDPILQMMNEVNSVLETNKTMLPEWTQMQIDAANEAARAWEEFGNEFNKRQGLRDVFDFKIDTTKMTKDWLKDITDKSQFKDIKLDLKFTVENESIAQVIRNISSAFLKAGDDQKFHLRFEYDESEATNTAKDIKKKIDKQLEEQFEKTGTKDPFQQALSNKIKEALKDGLTESEWQEILEMMSKADTPSIKVEVDPLSISEMGTDIATKIGDILLHGKITGISDDTGLINAAGGFNAAEGTMTFESRQGIQSSGGGGGSTNSAGDVSLTGVITNVVYRPVSGSIPFEPFPQSPSDEEEARRTAEARGEEYKPKDTGVAKIDISAATALITRLIGNYQGYIGIVNNSVPIAKLNITTATGLITRLMDNFAGYFKFVNDHEPSARLDITGAVKLISRLIDDHAGYVNFVNKETPKAQIDITGAVKQITRLIDDFYGYVKAVEDNEPEILIDNEDALDKIQEVIDKIAKVKDKSVTITTHHDDVFGGGGIVKFGSAAGGMIETSHGKRLIMIGDNPGGTETHAMIPANDPWPTISGILSLFGSKNPKNAPNAVSSPGNIGGGYGGDIHITNVIYDYEINRRYSMRQGANQGRYG